MASQLIANLRAELEAAAAVLDPQIRGLQDLAVNDMSISDSLRAEVNQQLAERKERRLLIQNVLDALDALEADGYPDLPQDPLVSSLFSELQEQVSDIQAAASVFRADVAAHITVTLGSPQPKG